MTGLDKLIAKWRKDAAIPCCDTGSGHEDGCRCKGLEACANELESLIPEIEALQDGCNHPAYCRDEMLWRKEIAALTEPMKCGHPKSREDIRQELGSEKEISACLDCEHERLAVEAALRRAAIDTCNLCLAASEPNARWSKANSNGKHFAGLEERYCDAFAINRLIPAGDHLDAHDAEVKSRTLEEATFEEWSKARAQRALKGSK